MIDPLGHPIRVGDTVLINDYETITTVKRLTKQFVIVNSKCSWHPKNEDRRDPRNVLVIDKQKQYNEDTYPENFL